MSSHDRIYDNVFPPPSDVDAPTPTATPLLGASAEGAPFGSPEVSQTVAVASATDQITWNQSWHTATLFLALPDKPIDVDQDGGSLKKEWTKPYTAAVRNALHYLRPGMLAERMQQTVLPRDDLLAWYFQHAMMVHYLKHVLPDLLEVWHLLE
jgi:anaphase-promoting complex subunit 2